MELLRRCGLRKSKGIPLWSILYEKIDLSVPEGVSVEDPVRMYLKEIGKVPLLSADEEIELAQNMEDSLVVA